MTIRNSILQDTDSIQIEKLPNGIHVLTETMPGVETMAVGAWTDAGSAEESAGERGMAHFLEHMLFKGTASRTAFDIADSIESLGGNVNAYTERDATNIYAHTLAEHLPRAVDLLADMICRSEFAPSAFERERQVVIEEIRKYESLHEERVHDLFMEALWKEGGLGYPIQGDEEGVRALTREGLLTCWRRHFSADRLVIAAAGKVEHERVVDLVSEAFADLKSDPSPRRVPNPGRQVPFNIVEDDLEQITFCWGGYAYAAGDERQFPLAIIDGVLGASTTSRLFQEVREQRGLAYDISSYIMSFRDCGLFCTTGATSPESFPEMMEVMSRQIAALREQGMTRREFERTKEQIKAGLALSLESTLERMRRLAGHFFTWGEVHSLAELMNRLDKVTEDDVARVIAETLDPAHWSFAAIGPIQEKTVIDLISEGSSCISVENS